MSTCSTHYCIGNPCWICFPNMVPDNLKFSYHKSVISDGLKDLLAFIFKNGLDNSAFELSEYLDKFTINVLQYERLSVDDASLEARLLDLLIENNKFFGIK